jgi:hypothetical protein
MELTLDMFFKGEVQQSTEKIVVSVNEPQATTINTKSNAKQT